MTADPTTTATWTAPLAPVPIRADIDLPGSKSETNRALLLAALAGGPSVIRGGLVARDTDLMRDALTALGVTISETADGWLVDPPDEFEASGEIDCGLAGTVMRFVPALAALATGSVRFTGDPVASQRPLAPLLQALCDLGATVDGDAIPCTVHGNPDLRGGELGIDASASSQFLSALLLIAPRLPDGLDLFHTGRRLPSHPHIAMTVAMLRERGVDVTETIDEESGTFNWRVRPGPIEPLDVTVAPDLSNAAPFLAAAVVTSGEVSIRRWPARTEQPGDQLRHLLRQFGADAFLDDHGLTVTGRGGLDGISADLHGASELTPVIAAIAALADSTTELSGIGHIRGHETDRMAAIRTNIEALGGRVTEREDSLIIHPHSLHSGPWRSYADHRLAQAGAVIGLIVDDVVVDDIGCTAKTMPEFPALWQQMIDASVEASEAERLAETPGDGEAPEPEADPYAAPEPLFEGPQDGTRDGTGRPEGG